MSGRNPIRFSLVLLLLSCAAAVAPAQMQQRRRAPIDPKADQGLSAAVATFDGTIRVVEKRQLVLEVGEEQSLTLVVNKKTSFLNAAGKAMKAADVKPGTDASVGVSKVMGDMIAITVRLKRGGQQ